WPETRLQRRRHFEGAGGRRPRPSTRDALPRRQRRPHSAGPDTQPAVHRRSSRRRQGEIERPLAVEGANSSDRSAHRASCCLLTALSTYYWSPRCRCAETSGRKLTKNAGSPSLPAIRAGENLRARRVGLPVNPPPLHHRAIATFFLLPSLHPPSALFQNK